MSSLIIRNMNPRSLSMQFSGHELLSLDIRSFFGVHCLSSINIKNLNYRNNYRPQAWLCHLYMWAVFRFYLIPQEVNMITESLVKSCPAEFVTAKRKEEIHMFGFSIVGVLEFHGGFQTECWTNFFLFLVSPR